MSDDAGPSSQAGEYRDRLPEELDASGYGGPYTFPNNNRRRISAGVYLVVGAVLIGLWAGRGGGVLVNRGLLAGGIVLVVLAGYHAVAGTTLRVSDTDALVAATRAVGFPVGHASAQLSWRRLVSRPTWRILVYSADDPPSKRGLVLVDGVTGEVGDHFTEANPEDWTALDR